MVSDQGDQKTLEQEQIRMSWETSDIYIQSPYMSWLFFVKEWKVGRGWKEEDDSFSELYLSLSILKGRMHVQGHA